MDRIKLVFDSNEITGLDYFKLILVALREMGLPESFSVKGCDISIPELEAVISKKNTWPSGVGSKGMDFMFGRLPAWKICFLEVSGKGISTDASMQEFAQFLIPTDGFIQAWIYDIEYEYWQNAKDPLEYEKAGRSTVDIPKRSNGLPAPLNQLEIDTSHNPGRTELKIGYVEAIGRLMWLGEKFWSRVGVDKVLSCDLLKDQGFDVAESQGVVKVIAGSGFCDVSTQARQIIARKILFGG
ncbi:hypothetical protein [Achromobacter deleyi]|uniref:hypothetical protein n=1 Tax=Achromobacter deleyi TaxID=1353891 RepID=UPI001490F776|nr:hypothetical protein [Achromobacter deleyi]QVQ28273.1 hypothetical protein HLG70_07605 [Achromobacter deleyi]